ncbi:MAG TPA: dinitrogenase iron-molybdenum cofactor biosynthesis protein [Phycisphaerales bacterium]|nr:dinitrogenase iron-molybdenum cofactor biosynthesis protein [Phycisphaerales bacterium]
MKIAVTAQGPDLDAAVDPRFGRAAYFLLVDTETMDFSLMENEASQAAGGAGVSAAQAVIDAGAEAVLTGNCGPNAFRTLKAGGVSVYTGVSGTVREAIEGYVAGRFSPDAGANVQSHHGTEPQE